MRYGVKLTNYNDMMGNASFAVYEETDLMRSIDKWHKRK